MSVPRGLRNNNPGNIRLSKDKWQGLRERQEDKEFFQFVSIEWGLPCVDAHVAELPVETRDENH